MNTTMRLFRIVFLLWILYHSRVLILARIWPFCIDSNLIWTFPFHSVKYFVCKAWRMTTKESNFSPKWKGKKRGKLSFIFRACNNNKKYDYQFKYTLRSNIDDGPFQRPFDSLWTYNEFACGHFLFVIANINYRVSVMLSKNSLPP